ncbi:MAG TPA: PAS domain S-box protein [Candidatus Eisenbacteria bacterium]|nr:PAS domain S-box protein [Candidatus Eisenbacteria bacterium]
MTRRLKPEDWAFLFDTSADGIFLVGKGGEILHANPRACELLGYRLDELVKLRTADIVAPEDLNRHLKRLDEARTNSVLPEERRMRRRDGTVFRVEGWGRGLADGSVVGFIRDIEERRLAAAERDRAEDALRLSEKRFRALIEGTSDVVAIVGADRKIRYQSPSIERVLGYEPASMIGRDPVDFIHAEDRERAEEAFMRIVQSGSIDPLEVRMLHRDGTWRVVEGWGVSRLDDPDIQGMVIHCRDVSDRHATKEALLQSESQLRHSQRLESVGRLAGGIAHDFNNLLTVILAYSEQQIAKLGAEHPLSRAAVEIHKAATRAASLTRQLLAFSRRQVLEPSVLDLDAVLADLGPMLKRVIGEDIDLHVHPGEHEGRVRADRLQIEQVVMNLVVNARDAMPHGGRLTIDTGRVTIGARDAARLEGLVPGPYVTLRVCDSGIGMDPDVRAKLFEPFFTTKERGEGTGLGLSTAYGIVQQSGGAIEVESEPDQGATFTIYLPSVEATVAGPAPAAEPGRENGGHETVLLAEDEAVVRDLMSELMQGAGYHVLEAQGGRAALEVSEAFAEPIHLLLTDVVMPGMSGRELAEKITARRPETRVLYVSGYTRDLIARQGILEPGVHLLQKPFDPDVLLRKIREILDSPGRQAA